MGAFQGVQPMFATGDETLLNALLQAARRVNDSFARELAPEGLSLAALRALEVIVAGGSRGLSQSDLGLQIGLSPASITRLVDELALRRLVERHQHIHDRRTKMLTVTEAGERQLTQAHRRLADFEANLMGEAGQTASQLLCALQRIAAPPERRLGR